MLGAAAAFACSRSERAEGGSLPPSPNVSVLEWDLGSQPWGPGRAVVLVPTWAGPAVRLPVLVALHGRGEAMKAPADGAMGWPRDYALARAFERLHAPPLVEADYEGLVTPTRMAEVNAALVRRAFKGVIVVCPWLPDIHPAATADVSPYARFIISELLPRVHRETPSLTAPEATGIDGVSLGGVEALRIGLNAPETFGAVGGTQPAIAIAQTADLSTLALGARARRPEMKLRLVTSRDDYFRDPILALTRAWDTAGIAHEFADLPGPHDYIFNRGPGSIELLFWYDSVLGRV
jgi:enterochelin esterase-like enzyme